VAIEINSLTNYFKAMENIVTLAEVRDLLEAEIVVGEESISAHER
jgi:hypothetical protein